MATIAKYDDEAWYMLKADVFIQRILRVFLANLNYLSKSRLSKLNQINNGKHAFNIRFIQIAIEYNGRLQ